MAKFKFVVFVDFGSVGAGRPLESVQYILRSCRALAGVQGLDLPEGAVQAGCVVGRRRMTVTE
jgi:hypothetical protein